jgi:hypothetical protein
MALNDLTPGEFARQFRLQPETEDGLNVEH